MAMITPPSNTVCTQYKKYNLTFTPPAVPPQNGYVVRWKYLGTSDWVYNQIMQSSNGIIQITVPTCDPIVGEVLPYCGTDNIGGPVYGTPSTFSIAASATYTVQMSQASCALGVGVFNLTGGKPSDVIVLKLTVTGNAIHNPSTGNCAWITTQISDTVSTTVDKISSAILDVMTPQTFVSEISVTLSQLGTSLIQTKIFAYNLLGNGGLSATLEVVSIGGKTPTSPISLVPCIGYQQIPGCAPNNG